MTRRTEVVVIALAVVLAAVAVWGWLAWAAHRDETGMARVVTPEEVSDSSRRLDDSPPYKRPRTTYNLPDSPDRGWPTDWPTQHEIGLLAWSLHLDHLDSITEAEAEAEVEVDASSMAVERQASGEIVVTNPPEAPVEAVPEGELEALICSYSWDCGTALRVARCESTMNPRAVGRAGERGIFQVHPVHAPSLGALWDDMFDPATNVEVAHNMWRSQGWGPWTCARGNR